MGTVAVKRRGVLARWLACGRRAGLTAMRLFPDSCRLCRCRVVLGYQRPEPRSGEDERAGRRGAAADHRGRGRGSWRGWRGWGSSASPGCAVGGVVSHAPIGHLPGGGCHDRDIRGPGCSVRSSSAARPAHAVLRAHPGLGDPSRLVTASRAGGADVVVACTPAVRSASVSRCQARVSSLRRPLWWRSSYPGGGRSPRSWRRSRGAAWRSALPRTGPTAATPSPAWRGGRAGRCGPSRARSG
jgi:hypothetical protein